MPNKPELDAEGGAIFSQSAINLFRKCPELARRVWNGEVEDWPGDAALAGIFAHSGIAAYVHSNDPSTIAPAVKEAIREEIAEGNPYLIGTEQEVLDEWMPLAAKYLQERWAPMWLAQESKFPRIIGTEVMFRVRIGNHWVIGSRDVVHERGVVDWKFSDALHWGDEGNEYGGQAWKHKRYDVQPTVYLEATAQEFECPIESLEFTYFVLRKDGLQEVTCHRNSTSVENLVRELDAIVRTMTTNPEGPWPLNPTDWHCSPNFCPNWTNCMGSSEVGEPWIYTTPKAKSAHQKAHRQLKKEANHGTSSK